MFVGDQGHSKIMRVDMEKVNGVWQGACFPFREGVRIGPDPHGMGTGWFHVCGTNRPGLVGDGQGALRNSARWCGRGKLLLRSKPLRSKPDGFEVTFTLPVDAATAGNPASYSLNSFNYKYHHTYGSPIINAEPLAIKGIVVAADGLSARLVVDETKLRKGYIHEVKAEGVKSKAGLSLLHNAGYYTLNEIAPGGKADASRFTASSSAMSDKSLAGMDHSQHTADRSHARRQLGQAR